MNYLILKTQGFYIFNFYINLYGFLIAIGMILGITWAVFICAKKGYDKNLPFDLALFALPCAIVGARLYYCAFNGVENFLQIFKIWEGGMAIYGGVIGGFLGVFLCCKIKKESLVKACDIAAPCLILGQAIGRVGCYFANCCYGIETTNVAMQVFPISILIGNEWHLATFFYESVLDLIGFVVLSFLTFKTNKNGIVTSSYLITYGIIRAVLEQFRDPSELLTLGSTNIRVSQLLSVLLIVVGIILLFISLKKNNKQEGKSNNE